MTWKIQSERDLYRDQWVHLTSADVLLPDGRHLDHRIIRTAAPGAGLVVVDDQQRVLLIWRHRFITGTHAWKIPRAASGPVKQPPRLLCVKPKKRPAGAPPDRSGP